MMKTTASFEEVRDKSICLKGKVLGLQTHSTTPSHFSGLEERVDSSEPADSHARCPAPHQESGLELLLPGPPEVSTAVRLL